MKAGPSEDATLDVSNHKDVVTHTNTWETHPHVKAKLIHERSLIQALCNKSRSVHLFFTHPAHFSLYRGPDTFRLFTPTPWPNLAPQLREIKSGLVKSLHFLALASSIKLSLLVDRLNKAAKQM